MGVHPIFNIYFLYLYKPLIIDRDEEQYIALCIEELVLEVGATLKVVELMVRTIRKGNLETLYDWDNI